MCGIAGFTQFHRRVGDENTLATMGEAIRHRGPDANSSYLDDQVGLHHRRLAIIDLSDAGIQPMHSSCGRYVVVFNGEIYNFQTLRSKLVRDGYHFTTQTDTEVMLAAYDAYGEDCVRHFNGMFAIAIWDRRDGTLFLARDRVGKKPLYYSVANGDIVFASELKALMAAELFTRKLRMDAVYDFFAYQYIPDPKTIFEGVYKLEPGHYAVVNRSGVRVQKYWDFSFEASAIDERAAVEMLQEHIERSTSLRMISDVPLGAFLSGGIDSSGIVATMAGQSQDPITTCTIGFDQDEFDETSYAHEVATQYRTTHHELTVSGGLLDSLEHISEFFDEPFSDPSFVPTYYVCKLAKEKVTVALAGDGGDEVFAGYEKYRLYDIENRIRRRVPSFVRNSLVKATAAAFAGSPINVLRRLGSLSNSVSRTAAAAFYETNAQITDAQWNRMASESTKRALGDYHPSERTLKFFNDCDAQDDLTRALYTDIKTYLPGDILVKVDRMSMAHALEVRAPLLDYELIEFSARLGIAMKYRPGDQKYILKRAFGSKLPPAISGRKKMGFSPPTADWLRRDLADRVEEALSPKQSALSELFDLTALRNMWQEHRSGRQDLAQIVWPLLVFDIWHSKYM